MPCRTVLRQAKCRNRRSPMERAAEATRWFREIDSGKCFDFERDGKCNKVGCKYLPCRNKDAQAMVLVLYSQGAAG